MYRKSAPVELDEPTVEDEPEDLYEVWKVYPDFNGRQKEGMPWDLDEARGVAQYHSSIGSIPVEIRRAGLLGKLSVVETWVDGKREETIYEQVCKTVRDKLGLDSKPPVATPSTYVPGRRGHPLYCGCAGCIHALTGH